MSWVKYLRNRRHITPREIGRMCDAMRRRRATGRGLDGWGNELGEVGKREAGRERDGKGGWIGGWVDNMG